MARHVDDIHVIRNDGDEDSALVVHILADGKTPPFIETRIRTASGERQLGPGISFAMQDGRPTLVVIVPAWEESLVIDLRDGSVVQEARP